MESQNRTPYKIVGEHGVRQLVDAFYDAMERLPEAGDIRSMHAEDLAPVRKGLTAYLTTWLGGPPIYIALKGSMCLTDAHAPFVIGPKARDQWLLCMEHALQAIDASDELKDMLRIPLKRVAEAVQNSETDNSNVRLIARG